MRIRPQTVTDRGKGGGDLFEIEIPIWYPPTAADCCGKGGGDSFEIEIHYDPRRIFDFYPVARGAGTCLRLKYP